MQVNKIVFALLSLGILVGCTAPGNYMSVSKVVNSPARVHGRYLHPVIIPINTDSIKFEGSSEYRVGSYDILNIVVWNHPELTLSTQSLAAAQASTVGQAALQSNATESGVEVDASGTIFYPFTGRTHVAGLTTEQIRRILTHRLRRYIRNPQVSVRVGTYRSQQINVIGELLHPGTQALTNKPLSLLDAVNAAGGIAPQTADTAHIYVFRNYHNTPIIYWLDAQSPQKILLAEKFMLKNNDVVYVAAAGIVGWNKIISYILPTVETIWYTHNLTR